jgi:hypothetical protein
VSALFVWIRAVVAPAWRRVTAVWLGAGIGGGVVFGPTGMHPHDLTRLALGVPAIGIGLALTWLLVYLPTARLLVRADGAAYLRSLPGSRWGPPLIAGVALVALQLPWLALWVLGDGLRGFLIVCALTLAIAALAALRPRVYRVRWPRWSNDRVALRGVYVRALRRRAGDAVVRGVGLAILAGLVAALFVHNNALVDEDAAVLGSGALAILLVPGSVGALLPLVEAQRQTGWLATSLGMSRAARIGVVTSVVVAIYLGTTLIALVAATLALATLFGAAAASTLAWLAGIALTTSLGIALFAARGLLRAEPDVVGASVRVAVGAIVGAALAVVVLGWLGVLGAGALVAVGACAVLTVRYA